ncbi:hypothetical protein [Streptomyces sp. NPDC060002]|uniref:hypothetical protein n=1 Tax=Streptomyces sp. NPDC060002 TaxID=3347033 RepID=UPI0036A91309
MPAATEAGLELESYMSRRPILRLAVLTALAGGALLAPATAALAADPSPAASALTDGTDTTVDEKKAEDAKTKEEAAVAARKAEAAKQLPRGGVDAGEAPAGGSGSGTTALVGSAAGALLLAGAGTFVVRRRAAGRPTG